jgi:hypothetical protein
MTSPRRVPIFNGHNDVLLRLYRRGGTDAPRAFLEGERKGQLDLPMARQGGFAGGLFAIFVPSPDGSIGPNGETPSQNVSSGSLLPAIAAKSKLFDDFVGAGEQRRRHLEAERLRGRQVDDQIELRGGAQMRVCYPSRPSARMVSCTFGLAPIRAMYALMFGHFARSILWILVQLSTVNR